MRLKQTISCATVLVLVTMMVCPVFAVQVERSKTSHHCSSEQLPEPEQNMQCCYDQNALSVQEVHAPFLIPAHHLLLPETTANSPTVFLLDHDYLPYLKTGDHLAKLSTLRL
ncbi:MAG TPA: hypothetical protein VI958_10950 [Acidobacteriota bacterium]